MAVIFRIFQHLLPRARAWRITIDKLLRRFFEALSDTPNSIREFFDNIWTDLAPQATTEMDEWERQWGLTSSEGLTEQERKDRLEATWKTLGGQSPRYIQSTIWAAGFTDVHIHQWWVPASDPLIARDPTAYVPATAELLVNKILIAQRNETCLAGHPSMHAGEVLAQAGQFQGSAFFRKKYNVTTNPDTWPFYLYFGAETFGNLADVPLARKDEFENLLLKICPTQQWLVLLINYVGVD